jgi:amicyanin
MQKTIIGILIVLVIGFGIYYFASNNNPQGTTNVSVTNNQLPPAQPAPTPVSPSQAAVPVAPAPSSVSVVIKNFAFSPSPLTIKTGTKVTWTNDDTAPHNVTSDSGNILNSGSLATGQSFSYTFNSAGTFDYHCTIHPMMKKGTVIVQN